MLRFRETHVVILLSIVTIAILIVIFVQPLRIHGDIGVHLETASRLLDGERPYSDYVDTNPPLITYINLVPVELSRVLGINPISSYLLLTLLAAIFSASAIIYLLKKHLHDSDPLSVYILPLVILVFTWYLLDLRFDYGQREHLFMLLFMPCLVLRWLRWWGDKTANWLAVLIGLVAGVGILIKPQFIAIAAAPELYWLITRRKIKPLFQLEIYAIVLVGVIYGLHFLLIPTIREGFLNDTLPLLLQGYSSFDSIGVIGSILRGESKMIVLIFPILALFIPERGQAEIWGLARPLSWLSLAAFVVYLAQAKGWFYQAIPFLMGSVCVAAILLLHLQLRQVAPRLSRFFLKSDRLLVLRHVGLAAIVLLVVGVTFLRLDTVKQLPTAPYFNIIEDNSNEGDEVLFVDTGVLSAFPTLQQIDRRFAGTYMHAWLIATAYADSDAGQIDPTSIPPLAEKYLDTLADDISRRDPVMIFLRSDACDGCPDHFLLTSYLDEIGFTDRYISPRYRVINPHFVVEGNDATDNVEEYRVYVRS